MKTTLATKAAASPTLKPLPIPRLKPISAETLIAFEKRHGPRPGAPPVDAVATLIRMRRGELP